MRRLIIGVSRDIEYAFRNDLFAHLEKLPMSFYQKNKTGELMSRATNDLSNVRILVGPAIMYTANTTRHRAVRGGAHDEDQLATHVARALAAARRFVQRTGILEKRFTILPKNRRRSLQTSARGFRKAWPAFA